MTIEPVLLSTAYFPPVNYVSLFCRNERILIEKHESYNKQTYRNRCRIYSANGPLSLTVPVLAGSFHKTHIRDIRVDYSKRWQQVHTGALISSYRSSPFFEYYFPQFEKIISAGYKYLIDLNINSLTEIFNATGISRDLEFTSRFVKPAGKENDYRYSLSPKKEILIRTEVAETYRQVFTERYGFIPGLSSLDLIFNTGPDSIDYLRKLSQSS